MPLKKPPTYLLLHTSKKLMEKNIVTLRSNIYLINSMDIIHDDAQSSLYFPITYLLKDFFFFLHNTLLCIFNKSINSYEKSQKT